MDIYLQIIVILSVSLATYIIVFMYFILNYKLTSDKRIGPKIGSELDIYNSNFMSINDTNVVGNKYFLIFVGRGCFTCEAILEKMTLKKGSNKWVIVEVIDKNYENEWSKLEYRELVNYETSIENSIVNYNISTFPYYLLIEENKVVKKGILNLHNLISVLNYEE